MKVVGLDRGPDGPGILGFARPQSSWRLEELLLLRGELQPRLQHRMVRSRLRSDPDRTSGVGIVATEHEQSEIDVGGVAHIKPGGRP